MVLLERIELSLPPYQRGVLPFNYKSLVPCPRFERGELLLLREMTLPICPAGHYLVPRWRIELPLAVCNTAVLPLNYRGIDWGAIPVSIRYYRFHRAGCRPLH